MDESQMNEVKQEVVNAVTEISEIVTENADTSEVVSNSQPQTEIDSNKLALIELEETLKTLPPEEVLKYQRELSIEMKENLFQGEIGELFKKYKPKSPQNRQDKVKNVARLMKSNKKADVQSNLTQNGNDNLKTELLKSKIELELVKQGVSQEYLEDASIIAMAKIKDVSELAKCKDIANRFSQIAQQSTMQRTSISVGEGNKELTDAEKAIQFLKKKFPKGYK